MVETWDPKVLVSFQKEWGLSRMDLLRELQATSGLEKLNYQTLCRWELESNTPRPAYQEAITRALRQAAARFERMGRKPKKGR